MQKLIVALMSALLLVSCQSTSPSKPEPGGENTSPKKIGGSSSGSGSLFSSIVKKDRSKSIVLPPDLVSSANSSVKANHDQAVEDEQNRVLPSVIGAEIVNSAGERFLRVESDAQNVWNTLADFWAIENIELVEYQPAAGLMETDWIATSQEESSRGRAYFKHLLNRVVGKGISFDKYKIRLERETDEVTNIFVTHRSTIKQASEVSSKKIAQYNWVEGDSDKEKVAQLLQVMVLLFERNA